MQHVLCLSCNKIHKNGTDFACELAEAKLCLLQNQLDDPGRWINILVAGRTGAGKTYYILALLEKLMNDENVNREILNPLGLKFDWGNTASQEKFETFKNYISDGYRIQGTIFNDRVDVKSPFVLDLEIKRYRKRPLSKRITIFNLSGESFEDSTKFHQQAEIGTASCGILLYDPTKDEKLYPLLESEHLNDTDFPIGAPSSIFLDLAAKMRPSKRAKVAYPLAICISKFDLLDHLSKIEINDSSFIDDRSEFLLKTDSFPTKLDLNRIHENASELRWFLERKSMIPVTKIRDRFKRYSYFATAPMGYDVPPRNGNEYKGQELKPNLNQSKGILAPFLWLLAYQKIIPEERIFL